MIREDLAGGTRYGFADPQGAVLEIGATSRQVVHPGAVQIRLTWQGDAVTSARSDNPQPGVWRFDLDPAGNVVRQRKLLDNILDGAPAFARPWARANPF